MNYNRARLLLGMSGVGTWVVLSCILLFSPPRAEQLLLLYLALSLPFDLLGGQILPRLFKQDVKTFNSWLRHYLQALLLHTSVLIAVGLFLQAAGMLGVERPAGLICFVVLTALQFRLAELSGAVRRISEGRSDRVQRVWCSEPGFTGGLAGWPGREVVVVPEHWPEEIRVVAAGRWLAVTEQWGRALGLSVALLWNGLGFWMATTGGVRSSQDLARVALLFTLWTFLGLLLLPSLARIGVYWADRETVERIGADRFKRYLQHSYDETRGARPLSEPVFYPIPSQLSRSRALDCAGNRFPRPWNVARLALYLSAGGLSLLTRTVHCNAGRPALWFLLPCD